jgi:hypothetical protein
MITQIILVISVDVYNLYYSIKFILDLSRKMQKPAVDKNKHLIIQISVRLLTYYPLTGTFLNDIMLLAE